MSDLRTAAQQALEALEQSETWVPDEGFGMRRREAERKHEAAITALRAALEQPDRAQKMRDAGYTRRPTLREMAEPEQEPVAWRCKGMLGMPWSLSDDGYYASCKRDKGYTVEPLYTHPPRREWRGLSEEEFGHIYVRSATHEEFARAIEAALRSKNHD